MRSKVVIIWGIALVFARVASADDTDIQARVQFEQGLRMYEEGDYENASIAFNRAYELRPSYRILFNVGQVETELKHYSRALTAFSDYLKLGGDQVPEERKTEVTQRIAELNALVGKVTVECAQENITVLIDGERRGKTPLKEPLLVDMGSHELSLREGLKEIYSENFRVAGGQSITLSLAAAEKPTPLVAPAPTPTPAPTPAQAPAAQEPAKAQQPAAKTKTPQNEAKEQKSPEKKKGKRRWSWVALGIGAASGIAGGVLGGISMSREKAFVKDHCIDNRCDSSRTDERDSIKNMALTADILYGVAGVGLVAGIVLFVVEPRRNAEREVSLLPVGNGLILQGRF